MNTAVANLGGVIQINLIFIYSLYVHELTLIHGFNYLHSRDLPNYQHGIVSVQMMLL